MATSVLDPSYGGFSLPGWKPGPLIWPPAPQTYNPLAGWPETVKQTIANPARVQPSFGASGIPSSVTLPAAGVVGSAGVNPFSVTGGTLTPATSTNGAGQFKTLVAPKNPAIDNQINALLGNFDTIRQAGTGDFAAKFAAASPQFDQLLQTDLGTIGNVTGGGWESQLAAARAERKTAVRGAADRALGDLTRILSLGRMGQGGGGSPGLGSYISKMGLDNATGIETQAALDDTEQARKDLETVQNLKLGLLGKSSDLLQGNVTRSLLPSQANATWLNNLLASFAPIVQGSNANSIYGVEGPGGFWGDSFGGVQNAKLGEAQRLQQANQFDVTSAQNALNSVRDYSLGLDRNAISAENAGNADKIRAMELALKRAGLYAGVA